jgi:uncharacterized repeat protein (TIGR01451 family)
MRQLALATCALLLLGTALAQANEPVAITLETFVVTASGERVPATEARPGQTVEYRLTATNVSNTSIPSGIVVLTMPILDGVTFLSANVIPSPTVRRDYYDATGRSMVSGTSATREVRWTYLQPLPPGASFKVAAHVRLNTDASPAASAAPLPNPRNAERDMDAFAQAMFGHLSVIEVPCPVGANVSMMCGETSRDFDSFMRTWDLHADWESRLPVTPPTPTSAWRRDGPRYFRDYRLAGMAFTVMYDNAGFVAIHW